MNLLLDTHAFLWGVEGSVRLGPNAAAQIIDPDNTAWLSIVSVWEIAIKTGLGRLQLQEAPEVFIPREMANENIRELAIEMDHALAVRELPQHHADPFDRLLIAQASLENLTIVTADRHFSAYGVAVLAADQ